MLEKTYLVDGNPVDFKELIKMAKELDYDFSNLYVKSTSRAADILRHNGHTVERNFNNGAM